MKNVNVTARLRLTRQSSYLTNICLIAAIIAHVSIHDMLGLDSLASLPQVQASFKETVKIVHPDKNNGVVVCGESQAIQKLNDAFKVYKDAHDAEADDAQPINQRLRAVALSASSSRSMGQGQAAPDGSSPAAASGPAPQPQSHWPAQGPFAASVAFISIAAHSSPFAWLQNDPNSL